MSEIKTALPPSGAKHEYLLGLLKKAGYEAFYANEEDASDADLYIAPRIKDKSSLKARGVIPFEYFSRDDFKRQNGILTAEAALAVAESACDRSLCGASVLILGFGCIGKPLARALSSLGSRVTVAARSQADRKTAELCGFGSDTIPVTRGGFDIVFNTVPAPVLDGEALSKMPDAAVIELASEPGGVTGQCRKLIKAPGLPGKYMPRTAAEIIFGSFVSFLREIKYDG